MTREEKVTELMKRLGQPVWMTRFGEGGWNVLVSLSIRKDKIYCGFLNYENVDLDECMIYDHEPTEKHDERRD